jgi:hypothetical protein
MYDRCGILCVIIVRNVSVITPAIRAEGKGSVHSTLFSMVTVSVFSLCGGGGLTRTM